MTEFDEIVIGGGLAGTTLTWLLRKRRRRVLLIDDERPQSSSRIAAGLITPVTGMRFVPSWRFGELLDFAAEFYRSIEAQLGVSLFEQKPAVRIFRSPEERETFQRKTLSEAFKESGADVREPAPPLDPEHYRAPHGAFEMPQAARLDVSDYLSNSRDHFVRDGGYRTGRLDSRGDVGIRSDRVELTAFDLTAGRVIFCEGFSAIENPWFLGPRFDAARGEILTVHIPALDEHRVVHCGGWLVPLGDGLFLVGATYEHDRLEAGPTSRGRNQLSDLLGNFLRLPFSIVEHHAAVRPILVGRHPVVGTHPDHPRLGYFNGLGSKGSLQAPWVADRFADHLLEGNPLPTEIDIRARGFSER